MHVESNWITFKSHTEKQEIALLSSKPIVSVCTGIQWGKSRVGAWRMKRAMHEFTDKEDSFLICAPTYKIMNQSTIPAFLSIMEGCGRYQKVDAVFQMDGGGRCYFRTNTEPDSIVGMTNVRHIWGDEAGKFTLYFWENMQARAAFKNCPITLTTSPYSLNWLFKELIKPHKAGNRPDVELIQAKSVDNPYFPRHVYEQRQKTMDPRRFNMIYGGNFDRMEGLVYDCWEDEENLIDPFEIPTGSRIVAGVDWGFNHPFVIKVRAITPNGVHIGISEFYSSGRTITQQVEAAMQKKLIHGIEVFYCDPSNPGGIQEFNRAGLTALGAENNIRYGLDLHYEMIKSRRYKEFRNACPYSQDERESYHYPEPKDLHSDRNDKEALPVDQNNHCMDVDRYITVMTQYTSDKRVPKAAGQKTFEGHWDRLKHLKRDIKTNNRKTENWG